MERSRVLQGVVLLVLLNNQWCLSYAATLDFASVSRPLPDEALYTPTIVQCLLNNLPLAMQTLLKKDIRMAAHFLRILFHDCGSGGCNGSILNQVELANPINAQLQGTDYIPTLKQQLNAACGTSLSMADTIVLGAAAGLYATGGPDLGPYLKLGRRDSSRPDNPNLLPTAQTTADQLVALFGSAGFTAEELVALSGAHSIGQSTCQQFLPRLSDGGPGADQQYLTSLTSQCHTLIQKVDLDFSPLIFDNGYYKNLQTGKGIMTSDQSLYQTKSTAPFVEKFANDTGAFYDKFSLAFLKLSFIGYPAIPVTVTNTTAVVGLQSTVPALQVVSPTLTKEINNQIGSPTTQVVITSITPGPLATNLTTLSLVAFQILPSPLPLADSALIASRLRTLVSSPSRLTLSAAPVFSFDATSFPGGLSDQGGGAINPVSAPSANAPILPPVSSGPVLAPGASGLVLAPNVSGLVLEPSANGPILAPSSGAANPSVVPNLTAVASAASTSTGAAAAAPGSASANTTSSGGGDAQSRQFAFLVFGLLLVLLY